MNTQFTLMHEYQLFQGLNDEQMQAVMHVCREECFLPNTVLFEEGQHAEEIFVLVEGRVEESFTVDEARLSLLRPVQQGEMIGCPALIPPYRHNCSARSLDNIEVLAIDAPGLRNLFIQNCPIARVVQQNVITALLWRLSKTRIAGVKAI
jgi:CRP-like cAMP-binding protein